MSHDHIKERLLNTEEIKNLSAIADPPRVLAYGPTGSGKTFSLATLSKLGKGAILWTELRNRSPYYKACAKLGLTPADGYEAKSYMEIIIKIKEIKTKDYVWVAHDGLSADAVMFDKELFPMGMEYGQSDSFSKWKVAADRIWSVSNELISGPWKFVVVSGLEEIEHDQGHVLLVGQKALKEVPPLLFNGMAHFKRPIGPAGKQKFALSFLQEGKWDAKDQFSVVNDLGEEYPDWYEIFKKAGRV